MKKYRTWLILALIIGLYLGGRWLYLRPAVHDGDPVPLINATLSDGQAFSLDSLRGGYVILDFWGSWCGPCIREMPALKALYEKYNNARFRQGEGLEIVGIAIEQDSARWQKALVHYALPWPYQILDHTTSLRFFNGTLAKGFGVRRLPALFLIDPDGYAVEGVLTPQHIDVILQQELHTIPPR